MPRQPHRQTKDDHMTAQTTPAHRPSSNNEINIFALQVNRNTIKNKLEELKMLIHNTHADVITTLHYPWQNTQRFWALP